MDITSKIRLLRNERGLSQAYVASELKLSTKTYSRMENGESKLYLDILMRLADLLNVRISQIIDDKDSHDGICGHHHQLDSELKTYKEKVRSLEADNIFLKHLIDKTFLKNQD